LHNTIILIITNLSTSTNAYRYTDRKSRNVPKQSIIECYSKGGGDYFVDELLKPYVSVEDRKRKRPSAASGGQKRTSKSSSSSSAGAAADAVVKVEGGDTKDGKKAKASKGSRAFIKELGLQGLEKKERADERSRAGSNVGITGPGGVSLSL